MATKRDLIEAQGFSRRRLLTAFTGGAPGGKELEPAKPLRAVIAGIALAVMLVLGGVFYGLIRPGLPADWENNRLIIATDTGARYISVEGVLRPVINTASARLLIPSDEFGVISTDQQSLSGITIGRAVGIVGAPDDLPARDRLVDDGWSACLPGGGQTVVALSERPLATPAKGAGIVVRRGDDLFVVAGEHRYPVDAGQSSAILRAVGLGSSAPIEVEGRWLDLFTPGEPLAPLEVAGAGDPVADAGLTVGEVVHPSGSGDAERYLVTAEGQLAPISPFAYQLYLLGSGAGLGGEREVSPAAIAALSTADRSAGGADWPEDLLRELDGAATPCARLDASGETPVTVLGTTTEELPEPSAAGAVAVEVGRGAVVIARGAGTSSSGTRYIIDGTGTAYAVPGSDDEPLARLGYSPDDVATVTSAWIAFFPSGPTLSAEAAAATPAAVEAVG